MTHVCNYCMKNNKCLYTKYIINNINIDELDNIFKQYINNHNQKFDFYKNDCEFGIQFDNKYTANMEINYHYNTDYINIKSYLLIYIDICEYGGFKFNNIIHMNINTFSCKCNMSYKHYINQPMSMLERRINFIIAKNPQLIKCLNRNKNHPLIRKYSHISFNNI